MSDGNGKDKKDRRPDPRLIASSQGKMVSLAGLVERVIARFVQEHGGEEGESADLIAADTQAKLIALVKDVANYVFTVESVQLPLSDQAFVIQQAYGELFGYGPLEMLFADESISTISIEGSEKIAVRRGPGKELVSLDPIFEDTHQLQRVLNRILTDAYAEIRDDESTIEVGIRYKERPININVMAPPFVPELTADIRLHPKQMPTLTDWIEQGFTTARCAAMLESIARSEHGFIIVGDTESGKTTLMSMLAQFLPTPERTVSVEWTGELRLPARAEQLIVKWPFGESFAVMPSTLIQQALEMEPDCILLDEVRADMQDSILPLLNQPDMPRQIWAFRGSSEVKRIRVALGMLARRSNPAAPEEMVNALYQRLPFIIVVKRRRGHIEVHEIAEWQYPQDAEYPDWVPLMEKGWDGLEPTDKRPGHDIDLASDFWA